MLTLFHFLGHNTASQKIKTLHTSLKIATESIEQFKKIDESTNDNSLDSLKRLKEFELLLQTTLKHLIQISITKNAQVVTTLKQLYSFTLQSNINRNDFITFSKHIQSNLERVQQYIHQHGKCQIR